MKPNTLHRIWYLPVGAIVGGAVGFAVTVALVMVAVSGGGAAQGIADFDPTPVMLLFVSIGAYFGGILGFIAWGGVVEPPSGKSNRLYLGEAENEEIL